MPDTAGIGSLFGRIDSFSGPYRFLSNFYPVRVSLDGVEHRSVEHAYEAAKTLSPMGRELIRTAPSAAAAKRLGKEVALRPDWPAVKRAVMLDLLRQKFSHKPLQELLLATGDTELVEGNHWGDEYWGVCQGKGLNWLGRLLMQVRDEKKFGA